MSSVMSAPEKVEDREQNLEDDIEIFSDEEVKSKKMTIVEKLSNTIEDIYSKLWDEVVHCFSPFDSHEKLLNKMIFLFEFPLSW